MTTRFPSGINNANMYSALTDMGQPDAVKFHSFVDDFDRFNVADWIITKVGTGTTALTAGRGGLLLITNTAAAPDSTFMQSLISSFLFTPGKRAFFKMGFTINDASLTTFQAGLVIADTTPLDATQGVYFQKASGSTALGVYCRKDATTGSTSALGVATLTTQATTIGFAYNGKDEISFFVNDVKVRSLVASTAFLPTAALNASFGVGNGAAVAKTLTVDYVFAAEER